MGEQSAVKHSATATKPAVVKIVVMKQPNTQRLQTLRLSELAMINKIVDHTRSSITQTPDARVKQLMDVHG